MNARMRRGFRTLLLGIVVTGPTWGCSSPTPAGDVPVIDAHTHFWDPRRPVPPGRAKSVPFSDGKTVLPPDYADDARRAGIVGTVMVEASGWLEDNAWALALARDNPVIVGVIGNLDEVMGTSRFPEAFARLASDPLFRGIRVARAEDLARPEWRSAFEALAARGLAVDVNAVGPAAVSAAAENARRYPALAVVLDHAGYVDFSRPPGEDWIRAFRLAAAVPNVYCKVSRIQEQAGVRPAPSDVGPYREMLDLLWETFGEDRLLFGSNWPLSERAGRLADAVAVLRAYLRDKGPDAEGKFFLRNAVRAYGLTVRRP